MIPLAWLVATAVLLAALPVYALVARTGRMRAGLVRVLLAFYFTLYIGAPLLPQSRVAHPWTAFAGGFAMGVGFAAIALAFVEYRRARVSLMPDDWRSERLVTGGIYGAVRHPQYAGGGLALTGWACALGAWLPMVTLVPVLWITLWYRARLEERYVLIPHFGEEYAAYRRRTGILFPRLGGR